jgi:flagellar hook-length control protein FliK
MQTLVALLVGETSDAKATDKPTTETTEGGSDGKDPAQPDPSTVLPIAIALPMNMHASESRSTSTELSHVEALLGEAGKSSSVATALVGETIDAIAAKVDSKAQPTNPQQPFAVAMNAMQNATAAPEVAPKQLHSTVGTPAWSNELGTQLAWMVDKGHQAASLRLSPEHLGPLEVRIDVRDSQATVWFGATHADTRAALEQSLPRLRELFAAQGLTLNDAGVFREAPRDQSRQAFRGSSNAQANGDADHVIAGVSARIGLFDAYA